MRLHFHLGWILLFGIGACQGTSTAPLPRPAVAELAQQSALGVAVAAGEETCTDPMSFRAHVASASEAPVRLEVEVQPAGNPFTGIAGAASAYGPSRVVSVEMRGLAPGAEYHWAARAIDAGGGASPWTPFATAGAAGPDFRICAAEARLTFVHARVSVVAPAGVDTTGWEVNAGLLASAPLGADRAAHVSVLDGQPQLVSATNAAHDIALLAVKEPGETDLSLDATSTAISLVAMSPLVISELRAAPAETKARLAEVDEVKTLAAWIEAKLPGQPSALAEDPEFSSVLQTAAEASVAALHPLAAAQRLVLVEPSGSAADTSGVSLLRKAVTGDGRVTLLVKNHWLRAVAAYVEDGEPDAASAILPSPDLLSLFPTPSVGDSTVAELSFDLVRHPVAKVKVYGPGSRLHAGPEWTAEPSWQRILLPTAMTTVDNFLLPVVGVVAQIGNAVGVLQSIRQPLIDIVLGAIQAEADQIRDGNWLQLSYRIVWNALWALMSNQGGILQTALSSYASSVGVDRVLQLASRYVPLLGQLKASADLAIAIANVLSAIWNLKNARPLEVFTVKSAPPELTVTVAPTRGPLPLEVTVFATSAPQIRSYEIDFGDGTPVERAEGVGRGNLQVRHTYREEGEFQIRLNVVDMEFGEATETRTVQVVAPAMEVLPALAFDFQGYRGDTSFANADAWYGIRADEGVLDWRAEVTAAPPWLKVVPASGTATTTTTVVRLEVDPEVAKTLEVGRYEARVDFRNAGSGKGDTTRYAILHVLPPELDVTPSLVGFAGPAGGPFTPATASFVVKTLGGSTDFTVRTDFPWFEVSPTSGRATTTPQTVTVFVAPAYTAQLSAGVHDGEITFTPAYEGGSDHARTRTLRVTITTGQGVTIASFTATPPSITAGGTARLDWAASGASGCTLSGGLGAVGTTGSVTVSPSATTTYTLTCAGDGGSATATTTVTVQQPQEVTIVSFTAAPEAVRPGESSTLSWEASATTGCALSPGIGVVPSAGAIEVKPAETTSYTLTCAGAGGPAQRTVTVVVSMRMAQITRFEAASTEILGGDTTTLGWETVDASVCSIAPGVGSVATTGTQSVAPTATTTYTLSCLAESNPVPVTATTTVVVAPRLRIGSFLAVPQKIFQGQESILVLGVTGATGCSIAPGVGEVAPDAAPHVQPSETTTYTLTCRGALGQVDDASVTVTVVTPPVGERDPTYNGGWQVSGLPVAMVVDPSSRAVVAGRVPTPYYDDMAVWRFDSDGLLDEDFGTAGRFTFHAPSDLTAAANYLALYPGGRIVVAGTIQTSTGNDALVWRLTPTGALDEESFGVPQGFVTLAQRVGTNGLAIDSQGRVVIVVHGDHRAFQVWRLTPSGAPDTSFNGSGVMTVEDVDGGRPIWVNAAAVDSTDRVVATGGIQDAQGNIHMALWWIGEDGRLVRFVTHTGAAGSTGDHEGFAVAVDASDRVLVTGYGVDASYRDNLVVWRYTSLGYLQGYVAHNTAPHLFVNDYGQAVAVDPFGNIVVAGDSCNYRDPVTGRRFCYLAIWRFTSSGQLDWTFGRNGYVLDLVNPTRSLKGSKSVGFDDRARILVLGDDGDGLWRYR